jgi:hypothetical protein
VDVERGLALLVGVEYQVPGGSGSEGGYSVDAVRFSRDEVVRTLRRAGLFTFADEAMQDLPDPVDLDMVQAWGAQRGITRETLISRMGGSP